MGNPCLDAGSASWEQLSCSGPSIWPLPCLHGYVALFLPQPSLWWPLGNMHLLDNIVSASSLCQLVRNCFSVDSCPSISCLWYWLWNYRNQISVLPTEPLLFPANSDTKDKLLGKRREKRLPLFCLHATLMILHHNYSSSFLYDAESSLGFV